MHRLLTVSIGVLACLLTSALPLTAAVVEDFEDGNMIEYTQTGPNINATCTPAAAHDGNLGLEMVGFPMQEWNEDWIYRDDAQVHNEQGDIVSLWIKVLTMGSGRAYCGFAATAAGCYSMVLAPNTSAFILYKDVGYGYSSLATTPMTWEPKWYRFEADWQAGGLIVANCYDSDGVTLLATVQAVDNTYTGGGIAFRYFGDGAVSAYFDTVEVNPFSPVEASTWGAIKALYQ